MSRLLFCIPLTKFWRSMSCRFACVRSWIKTSYGMWPLLSSVDVSSIQSDIARPVLFCTRGWWGDGSSSDIESLCLLDPPWLFPSGMFPPYPRFRSSCWWLIPVPGMGGNLGEICRNWALGDVKEILWMPRWMCLEPSHMLEFFGWRCHALLLKITKNLVIYWALLF